MTVKKLLDLVTARYSRRGQESSRYLKIHSALDQGAIQCSLVSEAALVVVVLYVAPAGLQPEPPAYLKFETALYLVAPIRAVHRVFAQSSAPARRNSNAEPELASNPPTSAFRVKRCGPPDLHFPARADHGIDPTGRIGEVQLVADSQ